ncbi:MAG: hypothetical protein KF819_25445 [Labilithrix sp.]|nr:hypothetical protein [Labilithrix sp.]
MASGLSNTLAEDLVKFFRALRPEGRAQYDLLAARDRELGEDVARERRESGDGEESR